MILFLFLLATGALLMQSVLFQQFAILAFAPWVALVVLRCSVPKCLWLACCAGAFMDLLSDDPTGIHAINYTVIAFLLSHVRNHFLYDNPLHLSLFTVFFSCLSTILQLFLLFLFDRRVPFSGGWALGDLLLMPIADGVYALVWFAGPLLAYKKLSRYGKVYWEKLQKLSL